jgi:hypothetical protein
MYYFRMVEPDFTPLPVYQAMQEYTASLTPTLYPGTHQEDHWALQYDEAWETVQIGKSANQQISEPASQGGPGPAVHTYRRAVAAGAALHFWFEGASLSLVPGPGTGEAELSVDGHPPRHILLDGHLMRLVQGWRQDRHQVVLTAVSGEVGVDTLIVRRPWCPSPWLVLSLATLLVVTTSVVLRQRVRR